MKKLFLLLAALSILSCQTMTINQYKSLHYKYTQCDGIKEQSRFKAWLFNEGYSKEEVRAVVSGEIKVGLSERGLIGAYGEPLNKTTFTDKTGVLVEYKYHDNTKVYLKNGIIESWQM